jgi:hypothetical protein
VLDRHRGQGHAVLGLHVGEDRHVDAEQPAVAQGVVGLRLDDALVGGHRAHVHVHPHEAGAGGGGDREGGAHVVLQHVDPDRQRDRAADLGDRHRHPGHARRVHPARGERHVAVILHHDRVGSALGEGARVVERGAQHRGHVAVPARTARERAQVDHADDGARDARRQPDDRRETHPPLMIAGEVAYNHVRHAHDTA